MEDKARAQKRVLILGLDAADYDFITDGEYTHLTQKEYGKVEINVSSLFTPVIWASFITGVGEEEHGISGLHRWDQGLVNTLRNHLLHIRLPRKVGEVLESFGSLLEIVGIDSKLYGKSDIRASTIFDYVDKYVAISVPSYNEDAVNKVLRRNVKDALASGDRRLMKETARLAWKAFATRKEKVFDLLKKDWDLFMCHFYVLDILQHLFWYDTACLSRAYEEMDKMVELIQNVIPYDDCLLLIVSDHGQKKGIHTPYGFYSTNKELGLSTPQITDFAEVVRFHLGLPSREDELKIAERLKELGYF